jgi:hypothetical protein
MESSDQKRRFPPPWRVQTVGEDCLHVVDANGIVLAVVFCRDDLQKWSFGHKHLTSDEARRIANAIARLATTSNIVWFTRRLRRKEAVS